MDLKSKLTKEMLEYEYKICGSMQKMADKLGISVDSISKYMNLYNISYSEHFKAKYSCNHDIFSQDSEISFYLAGFIAADGSLHKRKYSKILKITLSINDQPHLELIRSMLNSNHPIKNYDVKPSKLVKTAHKSAELQITSNQIFNDLLRFNIVPNKTKTYLIPDDLLNHKLINHFLRGYFDGDGTISSTIGKNRTIRQGNFSIIGTEMFIKQYKQILMKNIDLSDVKLSNKDPLFKLAYCGNGNITKIYDFLYNNSNYSLDRKHIKFKQFLRNNQ